MGKSYTHIKAIKQPDRTACWSTSMAWWTRAMPSIKNYKELDILGMYSHLIGTDGGLIFPRGYKEMLQDSRWGLTVEEVGVAPYMRSHIIFAKAPVMCGYWDYNVGGYHSVALYNFDIDNGVWVMDPNEGAHINQDLEHYFNWGHKSIIGYVKPK